MTTTVQSVRHAHCAGESEELLARLRSGDAEACEQFVRDHLPRMRATARRFMNCEHEAADAVQEAFVSALQAIGAFHGRSSLSTWLHRIVVNVCLMKLRSRKGRRDASLDDVVRTMDDNDRHLNRVDVWQADALSLLESAELRAQVRNCIDQLPETYRTIVLLRDIEEFDTVETARMLKCSIANVKTRLHRARLLLRSLLMPTFSASPVQF